MLVDNDRVVLHLKARLQEKRSWGRAELFQLIAELEVQSNTDGDMPVPSDLVPPGTAHEGSLPEGRNRRPEGISGSHEGDEHGSRNGSGREPACR